MLRKIRLMNRAEPGGYQWLINPRADPKLGSALFCLRAGCTTECFDSLEGSLNLEPMSADTPNLFAHAGTKLATQLLAKLPPVDPQVDEYPLSTQDLRAARSEFYRLINNGFVPLGESETKVKEVCVELLNVVLSRVRQGKGCHFNRSEMETLEELKQAANPK